MEPGDVPELEDFLQLGSAALATILFVVTALAWRRRPTTRGLLLALGFGLFAIRGAFSILADFVVSEGVGDTLESLGVPLEIGFLVLVAVAFLKA